MNFRYRVYSILPLLGISAVIACTTARERFEKIGRNLDEIAKSVEHYGTISVSSPLLFHATTDRLKFGLNRSGQDYFDDAKNEIHGASASFLQQSEDTQAGLTVRFNYNDYLANSFKLDAFNQDLDDYRRKRDIQQFGALLGAMALANENAPGASAISPDNNFGRLADIVNKLGRELPGPTSRPTFPTLQQNPPELDSPLPTTRPAQNVLTSRSFTGYQGLLQDIATSQPSRAAVITAAGDHMTQQILDFLSNPVEATQFAGKHIYFGVMMVACQPGDITYRGYRADVSVRVSLGRLVEQGFQKSTAPKTTINIQGGSGGAAAGGSSGLGFFGSYEEIPRVTPLIAAVSPMTEVQTLDLRASVRLQKAYALRVAAALSGMGAEVQGELFRDWVRRLERDVSTRSNLNAVTSYSISGGSFGYQIAPRLQAMANPAADEAKPDLVLQPITFPVLIIIGIDDWDFKTYGVQAIGFHQSTRWLRAGDPTADRRPLGRAFDRLLRKPRLSEEDMMRRMLSLSDSLKELNALTEDEKKQHLSLTHYAQERINMYGFIAGTNSFSYQEINNEPGVADPCSESAMSELAESLGAGIAFDFQGTNFTIESAESKGNCHLLITLRENGAPVNNDALLQRVFQEVEVVSRELNLPWGGLQNRVQISLRITR